MIDSLQEESMDEERIIALEVLSSYQEDLLKQLNSVVIEQQKHIEELEASIKKLSKRLEDIVELVGDEAAPQERPPHY